MDSNFYLVIIFIVISECKSSVSRTTQNCDGQTTDAAHFESMR